MKFFVSSNSNEEINSKDEGKGKDLINFAESNIELEHNEYLLTPDSD